MSSPTSSPERRGPGLSGLLCLQFDPQTVPEQRRGGIALAARSGPCRGRHFEGEHVPPLSQQRSVETNLSLLIRGMNPAAVRRVRLFEIRDFRDLRAVEIHAELGTLLRLDALESGEAECQQAAAPRPHRALEFDPPSRRAP